MKTKLSLPNEKSHLEEPSRSENILQSVFGYGEFRDQQQEIIDHTIGGGNSCVLMPTGSGKSLCYQIPSLIRDGVGIIVSPLIALMQDQVLALRELGVKAAAMNSTINAGDKAQIFNAMRGGQLDMIYVAPERLMMPDFLDFLDEIQIALFAIDEAHCVSQWGHDFRPEYQQLEQLRTRFPNIPCLAVTATADRQTRKEITERLKLDKLFSAGFDRPNITYQVAIKNNPRNQFLSFLKGREIGESGIVYCLSRRKVEETAAWLQQQGFNALPYHARLPAEVRSDHQSRFLKEEGIIMVATIAFGMGINKPDVRFVAHLDLPKNIEAYYQETGRAGRDGLPATAWMVYGMQDVALQGSMIDNGDSPPFQKRLERQKLTAFLGFCEATSCRRQILLRYFDDDGEPCNNCDICQNPPKTFDGTIAAQKALSCIYRTDQMFGAGYIIEVLLGKNNARISKFGHDQVSTYGIGTEHTAKEWQSIIRQLLARNFITADQEYGSLKLTNEGREFLNAKQTISFRIEEKAIRSSSGKSPRSRGPAIEIEDQIDKDLFIELKEFRLVLAKTNNIPPYVVFHDKTLLEMVLRRPVTLEAMAQITGVGASKLDKYGQMFLDKIN